MQVGPLCVYAPTSIDCIHRPWERGGPLPNVASCAGDASRVPKSVSAKGLKDVASGVGNPGPLVRDVLLSHRVCKQPSIHTAFRVMDPRVLWSRVLLYRTQNGNWIHLLRNLELSNGLL